MGYPKLNTPKPNGHYHWHCVTLILLSEVSNNVRGDFTYTKKFTVTYNHKLILDVKPVEILNKTKIGLGNY